MNPVDTTRRTPPSAHDLDEIRRSAEEARNTVLAPPKRSEVERYLNPPGNSPYALEYAFHLLGDARGKKVLDLGCGHGENVALLVERGAAVIGIDLSPELVQLAEQRMATAGRSAELRVGSAYETGLADESVDIVFCIALIHHLEIPKARAEMYRVLKKGGYVVLSEPIRFSSTYDRLRRMLPSRDNISEYEHPLTRDEFQCMVSGFKAEGLRYFRLPIVPLVERALGRTSKRIRKVSAWMLEAFPGLRFLATTAVVKLSKI
jgi:SAM-dependent methyltransferase